MIWMSGCVYRDVHNDLVCCTCPICTNPKPLPLLLPLSSSFSPALSSLSSQSPPSSPPILPPPDSPPPLLPALSPHLSSPPSLSQAQSETFSESQPGPWAQKAWPEGGRQVLTHLVEGFVIQEGLQPFPVRTTHTHIQSTESLCVPTIR